MSGVKHVQLPWRLQILGPQEADLIHRGTFMGLNGGSGAPSRYEPADAAEWEETAAFVALACNAHADLVAALERTASTIGLMADAFDLGTATRTELERVLSDIGAALAKAKGT